MDKLSLQNPVFAAYVIATTIMILKAVALSWLTVFRMMQVQGGFRSPEDIKKTAFNPEPSPKQLEPNDYVDRVRRIQLNDLESVPYFLVAGLLYVLTDPSRCSRAACFMALSSPVSFILRPISPVRSMTFAPHCGPPARSSSSSSLAAPFLPRWAIEQRAPGDVQQL